MTRTLKILSVVMLVFGAGISYGQVIDFEGVAPPGSVSGGYIEASPYFEDGFILFGYSSGIVDYSAENAILSSTTPNINSNGSDVFGWCGECVGLQIVLLPDSAGSFNLQSLHATDLLFTDESITPPGDLLVEGFFADGSSVGTTLNLSDTWTTFTLPTSFTNLVGVTFSASTAGVRNLGIDNIVVEAIPVPAAIWFFVSGLICLIGVARREKV